jgi:hypothetical protein
MMLVTGGTETNPGPQMQEKMERLSDHMMAQREEEGKRMREKLNQDGKIAKHFRNLVPK